MREREQRLLRQLRPDVRQALTLARRLTGHHLTIRRVHELGGGIHGALVRPQSPDQPYAIQYARGQEPALEQIIVHEVGHLTRLYAVPKEERLSPVMTPQHRRRALHQLMPELAGLMARGASPATIAELFDRWVEELVTQLANYPADLRIERWGSAQFPALRPVQERALTAEVQRGFPLLTPRAQVGTPPTVYQAKMGMNAAEAYNAAELLGRPNLFAPYRRRGFEEIASQLNRLVFEAADEGHRSDMRASEVWAQVLGVPGWFGWEAYQ